MISQHDLRVNTSIRGPVLQFDWPLIEIGVGSYEEGPTGLTIFRFRKPVLGTVDVRGGAPGTVNIDSLRLGYEEPSVDAVVFAGGSAYGQEAITAVATGLKDEGVVSGDWEDVAGVSGAILYDFLNHRLNEIYPDKRLAQATLQALRPGVFPLGAQGAGRMAMQGGFFGWPAHSGQGGAFREVRGIRIAAFTVINAVGTITDRDGYIVKDGRGLTRSHRLKASELLARFAEVRAPDWRPPEASPLASHHTTLSLVVTNKRTSYAELQRLAVQVHSSMARAIQPFSTMNDGDTLFAISTGELASTELTIPDLATIAGEVMWDAILASVPEEPIFKPPSQPLSLSKEELIQFGGTYRFGPNALVKITVENNRLVADPQMKAFFDLRPQERSILVAISPSEFHIEGPCRTRLSFQRDASGKVTGALINPGDWQQAGVRLTADNSRIGRVGAAATNDNAQA